MLGPTRSVAPSTPRDHESWRQVKPTGKQFIDMEGQSCGVWFVLGYEGKCVNNSRWRCRCTACGKEKTVYGYALRSGSPPPCDCRRYPLRPRIIHGLTHQKGYTSWAAMISRCERRNDKAWPRYGGRGIRVCPRWSHESMGLINFLADMGPRPEGMSIDRRDSNGNYEPGNCHWATRTEQSRNRRSNRMLKFRGRTLPLVDWALKYGLHPKTLGCRLANRWTLKRALTTPSRGFKLGEIAYQGRTQTIAAWAREYGLSPGVLAYRIRTEWPIQQALERPLCPGLSHSH
jgi:hypothetical protein